MPNTLAHLGIQGLATRAIFRDADYKWIYVGCILPDLPWIIQRAIKIILPDISLYDLRLYSIAQASLAISLIAAVAIAFLTVSPRKTFTILGFSIITHLLLDSLQTKWANGVHFFAPLSWKLVNFELFWPESLQTYVLTVGGLIYLLINWKSASKIAFKFSFHRPKMIILSILFSTLYFILPLYLMKGPEVADNHFVQTLRDKNHRKGLYVEMDRNHYRNEDGDHGVLNSFASESIKIRGIEPKIDDATMSLRGTFVSNSEIEASEFHVHHGSFREISSYVGLSLVMLLCIWSLFKDLKCRFA